MLSGSPRCTPYPLPPALPLHPNEQLSGFEGAAVIYPAAPTLPNCPSFTSESQFSALRGLFYLPFTSICLLSLSLTLSFFFSLYLSIYPSLSFYLSNYLPIYLSIYLSLYLVISIHSAEFLFRYFIHQILTLI